MNKALVMLYGKNHNQTHGFDYVTFEQIRDMVISPAQCPDKKHAPVIGVHDAAAKTKAEVLQHDNFTMLWADLDSGDCELYEIKDRLKKLAITSYLIYSTASSTPDNKRWRVLVEISHAIDFERWHTLQSYLAYVLNGDNCALRPQQILYAPFKNDSTQHYDFAISDNQPLDPVLSDFETKAFDYQQKQQAKALQEAAQAPKYVKPKASLATGQQSPIELYNAAYDLESLLQHYGFKKVVKKYIHPESQSGMAGVVLLDGRYYSHHESDPLNDGHTHDAFDLYVQFEHNGDFDAAIKAAAEQLDPQGQKQRQREYMQNASQTAAKAILFDGKPYDLFASFKLPDLDLALLPGVIADYSKEQGELIGVDPAALAVFCIGAAAACIDDRLQIQPKRHDNSWRESARLWIGVIGDPSAKKSPALKKALAPVFNIDAKWRHESNKATTAWLEETEQLKKGDPTPPKPIDMRLLVNDATVEKLGAILSEAEPRGILSYQDELSGWLASMDAYKQGAGGKDKSAWLEAYNGGQKFIDRITRGSLYVENWGIGVIGGIQPSVIQKYADSNDFDGMLQRFILVHAKQAGIGQDRPIDPFITTNYQQLIEHLAQLTGSDNPVQLSEAAHGHREALERHIHTLACNHPNKHLAAALGKYGGLFARLLLVWHCCDAYSKSKYANSYFVPGETAQKVSSFITGFLLPHIINFYQALDPIQDDSQDLARLILAKGWERFTVKRDFNQQWKASRKMKPWQIEQILDRLEGLSWITPDLTSGLNERGRGNAYFVNPEVHELHQQKAIDERQRRKAMAEAMAELSLSHA